MAVYSMTGYANASASRRSGCGSIARTARDARTGCRGAPIGVELRSVNGRFLDLAFRLPDELRQLEPALRELLTARFKRGKIELRAQRGARAAATTGRSRTPEQLQPPRAPRGHGARLAAEGARRSRCTKSLQWCRGAAPTRRRWTTPLLDAARRCVDGLREARAREGERLVGDPDGARRRACASSPPQAEPLVPAVVERQQQRFLERWNEALEATGAAPVDRAPRRSQNAR